MSNAIKIGTDYPINYKIGNDQVSKIYLGEDLLWQTTARDYSQEYFTVKAKSSGNVVLGTSVPCILQYRKNGGSWIDSISEAGSQVISVAVVTGDKLEFRGEEDENAGTTPNYNMRGMASTYPFNGASVSTDIDYDVYGNALSLFMGDSFTSTQVPTLMDNSLKYFFKYTNVINAANLILPGVNTGCKYQYMFYGCSSLVSAPALPDIYLIANCYEGMFYSCTSLTTAPDLPAKTLVSDCYRTMFYYCSSLNSIKIMCLDAPNANTANQWVAGVSSFGTITIDANATWSLPSDLVNWTVVRVSE